MTRSPGPSRLSSQAHFRVSGDLCPETILLRQDLLDPPRLSFSEPSKDSASPGMRSSAPLTSLCFIGQNPFNPQ